MLLPPFSDQLKQAGFELIGNLDYRLSMTIWWHPQKLLQVLILCVGRTALIKADKSYYLKSVSADGETWMRDLPALHAYLETHFPELRLSFAFFRQVPASLAEAEVKRRSAVESPTLSFPTVEEIAELQRRLVAKQRDDRSNQAMMSLSGATGDLLSGYIRQQSRDQQREMDQLNRHIVSTQQRLSLLQHLQREYQEKGSAASYCFNISSNVRSRKMPCSFAMRWGRW